LSSVVYADGLRLDVLTRIGSDRFLADSIKSGSFVRLTTAAGSGVALQQTGQSMMHDEKALDIARQVRKLVLATVEVHDDMEHRLELEESLYLALADYCQQQATLARGFLDAAITSRKLREHSTDAQKE
jgi:hypothetical protein